MKTEPRSALLSLLAALLLTACSSEAPPAMQGTLEWDRIALPAEASEAILRVAVREGQRVQEGELLVELDPARALARLRGSEAALRQAEARLAELSEGPRSESIAAARAVLARARASAEETRREEARVSELRDRGLLAQSELERASAAAQRSRADVQAAQAQLAELTSGTRSEQLDQAQAALDAAAAVEQQQRIALDRLSLRAPRAGLIDALPFKPGDQPPVGAALVSLLVGEAPYARVFVPAAQRTGVREGALFRVHVQGIAEPFEASLRSIASEPAFTPYYALAGDDASRLVYRAELLLQGDAAQALPAGLALQAEVQADDVR